MSFDRDTLPRILCQPGQGKSCGACCGMYNHRDTSHTHTPAALARRTRAYLLDADIHDTDSLERFRARWEDAPEVKLLDGLPSCPFLGLIDAADPEAIDPHGRVGCLVHPLQNDGVDGRDCGVYDRFICEDYLCAAHTVMRAEEKWLVLTATRDSYVYGLVVTDTRFVRALFEYTALRAGSWPTPKMLAPSAALEAASAYFELKRTFLWRAPDGVLGQVVPLSGLDTERRAHPAETLGVAREPIIDTILLCLGAGVSSVDELTQARQAVRERLDAFVAEMG